MRGPRRCKEGKTCLHSVAGAWPKKHTAENLGSSAPPLSKRQHQQAPSRMEAVAEWAATPDDVCKTVCRHLDLGALVRFGAVCRAWRQAAACPEAWEEVYRASWGDDEVLQGCSDLAQSFEKRWALLCELPALLWRWSCCAAKVSSTSAVERMSHLEEAGRVSQMLLVRARRCTRALDALVCVSRELIAAEEAPGTPRGGGRPALQTRWVRHVVRKCAETRALVQSEASWDSFVGAARHAQWLVHDDRLRTGWGRILAQCAALETGRSAEQPGEPAPHPEAGGFLAGDYVEVHSLQARPELNGSTGRLAAFVAGMGRWEVTLAGGGGLRCIDGYMYTHTYTHTHTHAHARTQTHTRAHAHTRTHMYTFLNR